MPVKEMHVGNSPLKKTHKKVEGKLVRFESEEYYKISNYDSMRPFFMSIVSDSNHWMFISSNGGLSAGRKNSESALFPYYTDDKITESADSTGSKTIFHIQKETRTVLWEPFSDRYAGIYQIKRNLYKSAYGNKLVFEEINTDLELIFRYHWNTSNKYGFIRKATLVNTGKKVLNITILDGIQNIMPHGIPSTLQNASSNLVDAYKKSELEADIGLGIYALSAIIVDKAEPSEALKATTVWSTGLENATYLISSAQLNSFREGRSLTQETDIKAEKGAYFISADIALKPQTEKRWMMVAEVNQSMIAITDIKQSIESGKNVGRIVQDDIELGAERLLKLNAGADALQLSSDKLRNTRHFSNLLFNIMRGGIFDNNYQIEKSDFERYLQKANIPLYGELHPQMKTLPQQFDLKRLKELAVKTDSADFKRLAFEYMPLKFSRRHGDPSRPWNKFSIKTETDDGRKVLDYEGNWRDIFQNWEALAHSYPVFIESMIHKFLNATTFDGYNPYRVTKDGFDWEISEPDDPWSYIGYWGDHQIIYLLKFLEFIEDYYPGRLATLIDQDIFVYANVPYKIKSYKEILDNPKDTILFDEGLDIKINKQREAIGADGALLKNVDGTIYKVNLLEKLLATVLAKVSNLIPEAGIWMNTQRPEWNDANNALVGNGVSMVTLYYLRRFLAFLDTVIADIPAKEVLISEEVTVFFDATLVALQSLLKTISGTFSDNERKQLMDGLGQAGSNYRNTIYKHGFSGEKTKVSKQNVLRFIETTLLYADHTICANKRKDGLYHAYNLMTVVSEREVSISYLSEMLEGQVAVLSSGYVFGEEAVTILDGLKNSALFRHDQYSYLLYPNKELPRFIHKNTIPAEKIEKSELVLRLLKDGDTSILVRDVNGAYHFNSSFNNADSLKAALNSLPEVYTDLKEKGAPFLLSLFEAVFDHKSFTGRSGTFFGYEGLGSIYWHMVSKLLLAVQEVCLRAVEDGESAATIGRLLAHYYEVNEGIGVHKSPELYGAFPTDPYSHTPGGKGAQQPGMTGQVKEDILSRFGELGLIVKAGQLQFKPHLLRKDEFLKEDTIFNYVNVRNEIDQLALKENTLAFTYCQVPIIYELGTGDGLKVLMKDMSAVAFDMLMLDARISTSVFERKGEVDHIVVSIKK